MKKLLGILVLGLLFTNNLSAEIVFRVICEQPQGKSVGAMTNTSDKTKLIKMTVIQIMIL